MAAVATANATAAAACVVVEAATERLIRLVGHSFDLFFFPDTLRPGNLYLCVQAWSGSLLILWLGKVDFVISVLFREGFNKKKH